MVNAKRTSINLLDWRNGHGRRLTHDIFKFPGKFHPPLVEHILKTLRPRAVLDPMCGVGTVALEAKVAGIPSVNIDVDPASLFFARVKSTQISEKTLRASWSSLNNSIEKYIRDAAEIRRRRFTDIRIDAMRRCLNSTGGQDFEKLMRWFRRYALADFSRVSHSIHNGGLPQRSDRVRDFFMAALLSSVRRISNADPSPVSGLEITSHMRKKFAKGYEVDVFGEFARRALLAIDRMRDFRALVAEKGTEGTPAFFFQDDSINAARRVKQTGLDVDLVFFSPPYCNAIEYWRRHRLEYILGKFMDLPAAVSLHHRFIGRRVNTVSAESFEEIGFHPVDALLSQLQRKKRAYKARLLWQYFNDMHLRLVEFQKFLKKGGHCVVVVGDSRTHDALVPTVKTLEWLGKRAGFRHIKTSQYRIRNRVMQFPTKTNKKIEGESIILFRKP